MKPSKIPVFITSTGYVTCTNVFSDNPNGIAFTYEQIKRELELAFTAGGEAEFTMDGFEKYLKTIKKKLGIK